MAFDVPIFVNVRDRLTDLRALVGWLERAGHERITLLDNDSEYPPLLDYLDETPHAVVRLGENLGARAIWEAGLVPDDEFCVYTDPDVVPLDECPPDAVERLVGLLHRHLSFSKAGLGLYLEDVPRTMLAYEWERGPQINGREVEPHALESLIDTTFAVYRPGVGFGFRAIRTAYPYVARHGPWYRQDRPLTDEQFYLRRARAGGEFSTWVSQCAG